MKTREIFLVVAIAAFATVTLAPAATAGVVTYGIDPAHSDVAFQVRHLLTKVRGKFDSFEGAIRMDADDLTNSSVEFKIAAASINTGNEQRDDHLRSPDFFDVENHSELSFKSSAVQKAGDNEYQVTGTLKIHGVEKEIILPVTFLGEMEFQGGIRAGFETAVKIDRKDWGIVWNRALDQGGAILGDEVAIEINLETVRQEAEEEEAAE